MTSEASVVGSLPPPRASDVLFGPGEDWEANACVSYLFSFMGERAYRDGFRRAAFQLAEQVCELAQGQDVLIYPIVFLYRHHVELALKNLIGTSCELLGRRLSAKDTKTLGRHDLADLWKLTEPLLNPVCEKVGNPPFPADDLAGASSYILQLHEHDPDGQRFRYATVTAKSADRHNASLQPGLKMINVRNFATALERLVDYLEGIVGWFDDLLELRAIEAQEKAGN